MNEYTALARELVQARFAWMGNVPAAALPCMGFTVYPVMSEPGWPTGRKGLVMSRIWQDADARGMVILDADVAIDPLDYAQMLRHIASDPDAVWAAPVRLWPGASGFPQWIWGHRKWLGDQELDNDTTIRLWQEDTDNPDMFTFCFTYLPALLLDKAIASGLADWVFPHVAENVWQVARSNGIPVRVVRGGCSPRHLNY